MPQPSDTPPRPGTARIDRWLFAVRLFGSRQLAAQAAGGGRVHVNGGRVKPAHPLRPGDRVSFVRGALHFECEVLDLPARRGPAAQAASCYRESPASAAGRAAFAARMKVAGALTPRPRERPDKRQRAQLRRLRGSI
jgi:ribosome-associated heat shock protein Hsp15